MRLSDRVFSVETLVVDSGKAPTLFRSHIQGINARVTLKYIKDIRATGGSRSTDTSLLFNRTNKNITWKYLIDIRLQPEHRSLLTGVVVQHTPYSASCDMNGARISSVLSQRIEHARNISTQRHEPFRIEKDDLVFSFVHVFFNVDVNEVDDCPELAGSWLGRT